MPIYIDAYNLIFAASKRLEGFDITQTEAARDRLIGLLQRYRGLKPERMVVFFDGGPDAAHLPRRSLKSGMEILFSDVKSDADSDIKNAVSHDENPRNIRVVTSDAAIRNFVVRYGAQVTDSTEFLGEILDTLQKGAVPTDEPIEKYEGPAADETEYWLGVFGEGMDDEQE